MKTGRPKVQLTVARMADNENLNPLQRVYLDRVLAHHDRPNLDHLQYACLDCGTIGEAESQKARDHNAKYIDFTCCAVNKTVLFRTEGV
jgi:hypothetical protein